MKNAIKKISSNGKERNLPLSRFAVLACIITFCILILFGIFSVFFDFVLYRAQLSQMKDATVPWFSHLESVLENQWQSVGVHQNALIKHSPKSIPELLSHMKEQEDVFFRSEPNKQLVAVDSSGYAYTYRGCIGKLSKISAASPDSFSSQLLLFNRQKLHFLYQLEEPLVLQDGKATVTMLYYGISEDLEVLLPYLKCDVYNGNNTTYVLNNQGFQLFYSGSGNVFPDYNVLKQLSHMEHLHGSTFAKTEKAWHKSQTAYANAMIDGTEYYYALTTFPYTDWMLLFLVPSQDVANKTALLMHDIVLLVGIFAVIISIFSAIVIYLLMRMKQQKTWQDERRTQELLTQANQKLKIAVQEADAASRVKSDFLANISHDIRTPINAIIGIAALMENESELSEKMRDYIHKIQLSGHHLLGLVNDVLDMSQMETADITLNAENISLAEQVKQVESMIRPQTIERKQNFVIRIYDIAHEALLCDGFRLRQVLLNLLSNAVKYTPAQGSIGLEIRELPCEMPGYAKFVFTVTDTGCGMTPDFLSHIFEPFHRAESSATNKVQGAGLGMPITKRIVDLMGGSIQIESEPQVGSRFTVAVPLLMQREDDEDTSVHNIMIVSEDPTVLENLSAATLHKPVNLYPFVELPKSFTFPERKSIDVILIVDALHVEIPSSVFSKLRRLCSEQLFIFGVDDADSEADIAAFCAKDVDGFIRRPMFYSDLVAAIESARCKRNHNGAPTSILKGLRFLCAEDNPLNAEILQSLLALYGASCTVYPDGQALVEAFEASKPGEYTAILMDIQMPKINGLEAAKRIRNSSHPLGKSIPMIAVTANAFSEDVHRSMEVGMNAHISKPIDIALLEKAMKKILSHVPDHRSDNAE